MLPAAQGGSSEVMGSGNAGPSTCTGCQLRKRGRRQQGCQAVGTSAANDSGWGLPKVLSADLPAALRSAGGKAVLQTVLATLHMKACSGAGDT